MYGTVTCRSNEIADFYCTFTSDCAFWKILVRNAAHYCFLVVVTNAPQVYIYIYTSVCKEKYLKVHLFFFNVISFE